MGHLVCGFLEWVYRKIVQPTAAQIAKPCGKCWWQDHYRVQ
ncbi:hypothetical protein HMPREF0653_01657 [Prevotella disiens JCM 6334 = ATCC 29426]|uniref:Uncharacterized protein n=1 Tax=Prevotella disiens JCM 6334 = ATCC 29426 TaxID=1235811 RepID=A0ABN0NRM0_9BACT|nr:hypothetical protein HMPREF0653_01657 [Prevotella disiens JCM 6334 = ATCC 29426]